MLDKRKALSPEERCLLDNKLLRQFTALLQKDPLSAVFLFASYGSEPNTYPMMEVVLANHIKLFLPKVGAEGKMDFFLVEHPNDLIPGYKGIPEPHDCPGKNSMYCFDRNNESAYVFVPGLAVDERGNRIGYGGGYYDRFLADCKQNPNMHIIFLGYPFQKTEKPIPAREWDVPVDICLFDI